MKHFKIPMKTARILRRVYGLPASITIVSGLWKTGKTDFALFLSEILRQLGLIKIVASNIETERGEIHFIKSLSFLKHWFRSEKGSRKLFLYDEVIESTPRRKPMSRLNVAWVQTIPQLSKARGHVIAITQAEKLTESVFFSPTFCRGMWRKINKKTVEFRSPLLRGERFIIQNIPPTNISFDPYLEATFQLEERSMHLDMLPDPLKVITLYAKGMSFKEIQIELELKHLTQVKRLLTQGCRTVVTYLQEPSEGIRLTDTCKSMEAG